jgi:uncharacterized cupin superfamily protein
MSIDAIATIDTDHTVRVVPEPASYTRVGQNWSEEEFRAFELDNGSCGGLWRGQPGEVYFDSWPYTEVCVILKGCIIIEDEYGQSREFRDGAAFVIPAGFRGTWITAEPTEKYFVGVCGTAVTSPA